MVEISNLKQVSNLKSVSTCPVKLDSRLRFSIIILNYVVESSVLYSAEKSIELFS